MEGVIAAHGGHIGGWSLYVHEGKLKLYNFLGLQCSAVTAATALPAGKHQVRMEFTYDGGGLGKGASVALYIDGNKAAEGRIARTHAFLFSIDETMDVGCDVGEPVSEDYGPRGNAFTGKLGSNRRRCGGEEVDHLIGAEERFQLMMMRQQQPEVTIATFDKEARP